MIEKTIHIEQDQFVHLYGINNSYLKRLILGFPKVKIVARGNEMKIMGEEEEILFFEQKINQLKEHISRYNRLTEDEFNAMISVPDLEKKSVVGEDEVLVYGNAGRPIKALTPHQKKMITDYNTNDLLIAIGPAGTGKTYIAIALAVRSLRNKEVKRIVLSRPAVEAEERIGYLPGDVKEKLDPYLQPLYDALNDMVPPKRLADYMRDGIIQIAPLGFMRGRTLSNSFVVMDEAQNATVSQMKMFFTRMGQNSKFIVTGDVTQIDLPNKRNSGLVHTRRILKSIEGISIIDFDQKDIVRHKLVRSIVDAYDRDDNKITNENASENENNETEEIE